jgi:preprotein translocase subunit SecF
MLTMNEAIIYGFPDYMHTKYLGTLLGIMMAILVWLLHINYLIIQLALALFIGLVIGFIDSLPQKLCLKYFSMQKSINKLLF